MKIPVIHKREPLPDASGVSTLSKVEFSRNPYPALLKEPAHFWDEIFVANVVVKGADDAEYQIMVSVLDTLRQLDITKMGMATE